MYETKIYKSILVTNTYGLYVSFYTIWYEDECDFSTSIEVGRESPESDSILFEEFFGRFRKIKDKKIHFTQRIRKFIICGKNRVKII